ncbi:hypothetical protein AB0K86_21770 [Streptomyces clavifer]|nr:MULTISPECIES: hypothetical protein [Streptomyces]WUC25872.1 hypothetical protein OG927_00130 [Streptomyces clavifer]WUC31940.1 hypothetical protein OG927_33460 [Streptomyces clavifer]
MGCSLKETDHEDFDRQAIMQRMTSVYLRSWLSDGWVGATDPP